MLPRSWRTMKSTSRPSASVMRCMSAGVEPSVGSTRHWLAVLRYQ